MQKSIFSVFSQVKLGFKLKHLSDFDVDIISYIQIHTTLILNFKKHISKS
jgi:hypothetical protein